MRTCTTPLNVAIPKPRGVFPVIRRIVLSATLTSALVSAPQSAAADGPVEYRNFGVLCTPGLFRACASVDIWTAAKADASTSVFATVSNVQGSPGFESLPPLAIDEFVIGGLGLDLTDCAPVIELAVGCEPPTSPNRFSNRDWRDRSGFFGDASREEVSSIEGRPGGSHQPNFMDGPGSQTFAMEEYGAAVGYAYWEDDGLVYYGCDYPDNPPNGGGFSLCNGSFDFEFNLGPGVRLSLTDDTYFEGWYQGPGRPATNLLRCSTRSTDDERCVSVPEPSTVMLMLTGVLGLGFVAFRRREDELA